MIDIIVVPLDGSPLAEQAVQPALHLARRLDVPIELVHVFEPAVSSPLVSGAPPLDTRLDADLREEATRYLASVASRLESAGGPRVTPTLLEGPVVERLTAHLKTLGHPLVVATTHGRSGIARALFGSVMEELIRSATAPVLVIRARKSGAAAVPIRLGRVLVPVADDDVETAIGERTVEIFSTGDVEYVLLHVVVPVPIIPPAPDMVVVPPVVPDVDAEVRTARERLDGLAAQLRARGAQARTRVEIDADPAQVILDAVGQESADAISMATRGRRGIERLVLGSVSSKVLRHAEVPVLLVRQPEPAEGSDDAKGAHDAAR